MTVNSIEFLVVVFVCFPSLELADAMLSIDCFSVGGASSFGLEFFF